MTSSDNKLAQYILPQLVSIEKNLSNYDVHFYLCHSRISVENIQLIKDFTKNHTGITLHEIIVSGNEQFYDELVEYGGMQWPREAYYTLRLQDFLPEDVDRIIYIDAGDVIIDGDIGPYYFDDFEGNSLIATVHRYKVDPVTGENTLYTKDDIIRAAIACSFNSGSYVIDVNKFRNDGYTTDDYIYLCSILKEHNTSDPWAFFGDQGLLSSAFAGDIKFFGYPQNKENTYMPYNFVSSFWRDFKTEPDFTPVVLHYAIRAKPWTVRFSDEVINTTISNPDFLANNLIAPIPTVALISPEHFRLAEVWWDYAKETPIYTVADIRARAIADSWLEHFLPMCQRFLYTYYELHYGNK